MELAHSDGGKAPSVMKGLKPKIVGGIFDVSPLDPDRQKLVERAVSKCRFDFSRLKSQLRSEAGKQWIQVSQQKMVKDLLAQADTKGFVILNSTVMGELVEVSFLSESAHMVDFFLLSREQRGTIYEAFTGKPLKGDWFKGQYWSEVGESFMAGFVMAYSDYDPDQAGFKYKSTPAIARTIRRVIG